MPSVRAAVASAAIALAVAGCATPSPLGVWAGDTRARYAGIDLEAAGRCELVERGPAGESVGSWCLYSYSPESGVIVVTGFLDSAGSSRAPETQIRLEFDRANDAIVWKDRGHTIVLHRARSPTNG